MDRVGILLQTPIFGDLDADEVAELVPGLRVLTFHRGESLWLEGDPARGLYVLAEGQLKSYRVSREGREVILALHQAVCLVGEVGTFHPQGIRWVNVAAMTPARCLLIGRDRLMDFLSRHPSAMRRALEQIAIGAVQAAYSFSGVAFDDISRRVAGTLLTLVDEFGEVTADGIRIRLQLSQSTLAAHVAASRENVNRALSSLVSSGVVSQRDGHFYVHDRGALERTLKQSGDDL